MASVVDSWSVADVERLLGSLDLGHLAPLFRDNGVSGKDLLTFGNSGVCKWSAIGSAFGIIPRNSTIQTCVGLEHHETPSI
jgi:hypothetical protein